MSDGKVNAWYLTGFLSHFKSMMNAKTPDFSFSLPKQTPIPRVPAEDLKIQWETPGTISLRIPGIDAPVKFNVDKNL